MRNIIKKIADKIRKLVRNIAAPAAIAGIALTSQLIPLNSAQAEPSYAPAIIAVPATLAANTTTNFASPVFIDASHQDKVALTFRTIWTTAGESTGSTNLLFTLAPTVDGLTWDTNKTITLEAYNRAASAGFTNVDVTNITASGVQGWYIIREANNSAAGVATNLMKYGVKQSAP